VLVNNVVFDFEERAAYEIVVRVEDGIGGVMEEVITIAIIDVEPEEVEIISGFTPDNDRMNDTWEIPGLVSYPRCIVEVYNSWGQQVFFSRGYRKSWDGTYKNEAVPVGTYYYIIDLDNGQPPITGNIAVMR
jgi:gliding motility-associated-like protein